MGWVRRHRVLTTLAVLGVVVIGVDQGVSDTDPVDAGGTSTGEPSAESETIIGPAVDEEDQAGDVRTAPTKDVERPAASRRPASPRAPAPPDRPPRQRTYLVTHVVDGDTVELGNGEHVRLVGIDTPERGDCNYARATARMESLVLGRRVRLTVSDEDRDGYGRLLRYVDVGRKDAGLRMIEAGFAVARYDSRDGYGYHPRENRYIAADKASPDRTCPKPVRPPAPKPLPLLQQPKTSSGRCAPGYDPCVPPYPPDVDCADVAGPVRVTGSDPHGLDRDGDGLACEG